MKKGRRAVKSAGGVAAIVGLALGLGGRARAIPAAPTWHLIVVGGGNAGPAVDKQMRVIRRDHTAIDSLYAARELLGMG